MRIELALLIVATIAGAAFDLRTSKIPNYLTGALALVALGMHTANGVAQLLIALSTMAIAFTIGSLCFSLGWLGGGDVKLIAAACALVSYPGAIWLIADILIVGAALAIVQAAFAGRLFDLFRSAYAIAKTGKSLQAATVLPYGVAIAGGSVAFTLSTLFVPARLSP